MNLDEETLVMRRDPASREIRVAAPDDGSAPASKPMSYAARALDAPIDPNLRRRRPIARVPVPPTALAPVLDLDAARPAPRKPPPLPKRAAPVAPVVIAEELEHPFGNRATLHSKLLHAAKAGHARALAVLQLTKPAYARALAMLPLTKPSYARALAALRRANPSYARALAVLRGAKPTYAGARSVLLGAKPTCMRVLTELRGAKPSYTSLLAALLVSAVLTFGIGILLGSFLRG